MKKPQNVSSLKKSNKAKNKLGKKGKLKPGTKSPYYTKKQEKEEAKFNFKREEEDVPSKVEEDDREDMVDEETTNFLKTSGKFAGYSFIPKVRGYNKPVDENEDEDGTPTNLYEEKVAKQRKEESKVKALLPIKTKEGLIPQSMEVEEKEEQEVEEREKEEEIVPLTAAEMFALRQKKLIEAKVAIGALSSNVLESPEENIGNMANILDYFEKPDLELCLTVRKMAAFSMVALFIDLAPGYEIIHTNQPGKKLKKDTRKLYTYEDRLLKYYRRFLKAMEKYLDKMKKKTCTDMNFRLGLLSLKCMCDLLVRLPHFNFSKNIIHAIVPFALYKKPEPRVTVCTALKQLFKEDLKGEISLEAVKQVNRHVKHCHHRFPPDCLQALLSLRIKDVNLDKEKMNELNRYRTLTRKEKLLQLSKRERRGFYNDYRLVSLYHPNYMLSPSSESENFVTALQTLDAMLIKRYKRISVPRALAYIKRIATVAMQSQHSGAAALLSFLRQMFIVFKKADVLLDPDSSIGSGLFLPELNEPEHCNASNTALWELHSLTNHYHPKVRKLAKYIMSGLPTTGSGVLPPELGKKSAVEFLEELEREDPMGGIPNPPEYVPKKLKTIRLFDTDLTELGRNISDSVSCDDFDISVDG
ncbi:hypothetical protein QYM36_017977 [Artemia franciscana]|uniref:NOC3-like protein n=1 Tax=Artemia franciscana TaxID=6661 RepID=A0AA88H7U2_ARTSF|nr:hypothetical protein QYM36_017977 [Artemia franciscana]